MGDSVAEHAPVQEPHASAADADEVPLGLGTDRGGLTTTQARRVVADLDGAADVVALTVAEYIPRQVMHLQRLLAGFPLLTPRDHI